jgi:hypothetical protein
MKGIGMITTRNITISVDEKTADLFENAPAYKKQSLKVLLYEWLKPATGEDSLSELMDQIGFNAIANGLTRDKLTSIINEEDSADSN